MRGEKKHSPPEAKAGEICVKMAVFTQISLKLSKICVD
jgi:hypothetical protein